MADSEYSTDDCKSSKISIVAIIKFQEMLKFFSDHLEAKEICKHSVKKLPFVIWHVPDGYKT